MKARCSIVDRDDKANIVFLKDMAGQFGSMTITNDAEAVVVYYRTIYGNTIRIVYQDTDDEWWEIVWSLDDSGVTFKQWHGLVWDILSRKNEA
jgi:hypothetical protein